MIDVKVGDYVSFDYKGQILYKVLDVKVYEDGIGYILYYDDEYQGVAWERFEFIAKVFEVKEKDKSE